MSRAVRLDALAGGVGGSWYVLMEGLARLVGEIHPDIQIAVVEGGGVSNHTRVGSGEIPMGILNPPMTAAVIAGRRPYDRMHPALRIGVANLTTNYLHCFVEEALPIESVTAWLEQRHPVRMPVDRVGTVDRMAFQLILDHFGVGEADIHGWGGEPDHDPREPGMDGRRLARGAYGIVERQLRTVAMGTSLGFHADVPDDAVYGIVRAICEHAERVRRIHPAASGFDPGVAHRRSRGPLHPGAAKYFREAGLQTSR